MSPSSLGRHLQTSAQRTQSPMPATKRRRRCCCWPRVMLEKSWGMAEELRNWWDNTNWRGMKWAWWLELDKTNLPRGQCDIRLNPHHTRTQAQIPKTTHILNFNSFGAGSTRSHSVVAPTSTYAYEHVHNKREDGKKKRIRTCRTSNCVGATTAKHTNGTCHALHVCSVQGRTCGAHLRRNEIRTKNHSAQHQLDPLQVADRRARSQHRHRIIRHWFWHETPFDRGLGGIHRLS